MPGTMEAALIDIVHDRDLPFDDRLILLQELRRSLPPETNRHVFRYIVYGVCIIAVLPPAMLAVSGLLGRLVGEPAGSAMLQVSSAAVGALAAYFTSRSGGGGGGAPAAVPGTAVTGTVEATIVEVSRDRTLSVEQRCRLIDELRNWLPPERNRWSFGMAGLALCGAALVPPVIIALGAMLGWSSANAAIPGVLQVSAAALGALAAYLTGRRIGASGG